MLIPSIDLFNGKAVQLEQGDINRKIVENENVFGLLEEFSLFGEVAIIDLNAALGQGDNKQLIKAMLERYPCRVGGGIRDYDSAREYLSTGAKKIIIGTACREDFIKRLPREKLIFAIDAKGDDWVTHGWQESLQVPVLDLVEQLQGRCSEFLYTQVNNEGLLQGVDRQRIRAVVEVAKIPVTVAGGISSLDDIKFINRLGANSQIGMSIYTGRISLQDALLANLDFNKLSLIPTIVQDVKTGNVLMLAYSSKDSLMAAIKERKGVYFSRSRNEIWQKGLTSGNHQKLVNVDYDCDGDSLLFKVKQEGVACHFERYSCFASQQVDFNLEQLDATLEQRLLHPLAGSYTSNLLTDENLQIEKLKEECDELIEAYKQDDVRWEAADLLYFTLANAKAKGVSARQIICELGARNGQG